MPLRDGFKSYDILGVRAEAATIDQAVEAITEYASQPDSPAAFVIKPYVEFIDSAVNKPEIRRLLNSADLSLADGVALQWAAHFLQSGQRHWWQATASLVRMVFDPASINRPLPERVSGINFTWPLLESCQEKDLKIYLIGRPKGGQLTDTIAAIHRQLPNLDVVGHFDGYEANQRQDELLADINHRQPDIVLVGTGFSRQEQLMARAVAACHHGVFVGEGGTFDYQSFGGQVRRAPAWMQRSGLEWLWRLSSEPWRLRRQLAIPRFVWRVWREAGKSKT